MLFEILLSGLLTCFERLWLQSGDGSVAWSFPAVLKVLMMLALATAAPRQLRTD